MNRSDQSLKNKSAKRIIPIHSFLRRDLKFISYVRHLKSEGEERLFPALSYNQREGYGRGLGRWFNDKYKHRCRIDMSDGKLRDFHSFRKNWDTLLIQKKVDWYARLKTAGHKGNVDDMTDLYFAGHPAKQLYDDVISKVDWEKQIDLSHLKESDFVLK